MPRATHKILAVLLLLEGLWGVPVLAQNSSLTINSDIQEANSITDVVVARGNVRVEYSARQLTARAKQAIYDGRKGTITLIGEVTIEQWGRDQLQAAKITYFLNENRIKAEPLEGQQVTGTYNFTAGSQDTASIRSDLQEANTALGTVTATGNIRFEFPARQIVATAQKATFNNKDRTIVMQGGVSILHQGVNTVQAESVTYAIDESRFIAAPSSGKQVRATYSIPDSTKTKPNP
ncbi:LptA/OstA family protein [Anthocerotibacter panamensis]|uniref:LptA/OstA family protein n=1 Tax=Anthocerotibacter panamensis TaxID=2857077 RepID=UPI001C405F0A|nr:LptA/OstA family protein [Anthocerotibacter panamensis]